MGAAEIAKEMREIMVLFLDPEKLKYHPAIAVPEHIWNTAGGIRPEGQRDHIEHRFNLLIEVQRLGRACPIGHLDRRKPTPLQVLQPLLRFADDGEIFLERGLVLTTRLSFERSGIVPNPIQQTGHLFSLTRMAQRIAKESIKDQLGITLPGDGLTLAVVRNVTASNLVGEQSLRCQFQGPVRRFLSNLIGNELINRSRLFVFMVAAQKPAGGTGMGWEAKVPHVIENEEIILVSRKGLHQRRQSKIKFTPTIDIPWWRMNAIGLEQSHEAQGRFFRCGSCPNRRLHQVQKGQRHEGACGAPKKCTPV